MSFYQRFQTAIRFAILIPFIPIHVKFETIIQSSFQQGFDGYKDETRLFQAAAYRN